LQPLDVIYTGSFKEFYFQEIELYLWSGYWISFWWGFWESFSVGCKYVDGH
jgi:hypothetical protein